MEPPPHLSPCKFSKNKGSAQILLNLTQLAPELKSGAKPQSRELENEHYFKHPKILGNE